MFMVLSSVILSQLCVGNISVGNRYCVCVRVCFALLLTPELMKNLSSIKETLLCVIVTTL